MTLDLKIGPRSSLLGYNAFVIDIVQLQKTYGLTTSSRFLVIHLNTLLATKKILSAGKIQGTMEVLNVLLMHFYDVIIHNKW